MRHCACVIRVLAHQKRRDGDLMQRAFVVVALLAQRAHAKHSAGQGDHFQIEAVAEMLDELTGVMDGSILNLAAFVQGDGGEFDFL